MKYQALFVATPVLPISVPLAYSWTCTTFCPAVIEPPKLNPLGRRRMLSEPDPRLTGLGWSSPMAKSGAVGELGAAVSTVNVCSTMARLLTEPMALRRWTLADKAVVPLYTAPV